MAQAFVFEKLMPIGSPLRITRDQVRQLQEDNVVRGSTAYHAVQFRVVGGGEQEDVEAKGKAMREVLLNGLRGDLRCVEDVFVGGGKWKEY